MARWSAIRHKLEEDYLAEALRGHIQYFVTSYSYSPDHEGRAAIRFLMSLTIRALKKVL